MLSPQSNNAPAPKVLVLAGTAEARKLCKRLAELGIDGHASLAGRVDRPADLALPVRVGGFGGSEGLQNTLKQNGFTHVIDATHPFAAQMTENAHIACSHLGVPLCVLTREPWTPNEGDNWISVPTMASVMDALDGPSMRVFLGIGRQNLPLFSAHPQHDYLCRVIDAPEQMPAIPSIKLLRAKGPFTLQDDIDLLSAHRIEVVVSKNSGGSLTRSKIDAARILGLPVIMIDRPKPPSGDHYFEQFFQIDDVITWLGHA